MGTTLCNKHGETGIVSSISIDICEEMMGRSSIKNERIYIVIIKVFDGNEYLYEQKNYISEALFKEKDLNMLYELHDELDEERINTFFPKTSGMCGKCFNEYLSSRKLIY